MYCYNVESSVHVYSSQRASKKPARSLLLAKPSANIGINFQMEDAWSIFLRADALYGVGLSTP